jgi:iron complex outermembrane recepter protein
VEGTIGTLSYDQTYQQCFDPQFNPNYDPQNEFCQRIRRDPGTGNSGSIGLVNVNRGLLETAGYDLQLNWSANIADLGFTNIRGSVGWTILANYVDYNRIQAVADGPIDDFTGTGTNFQYRINNTLSYRTDAFNVSLRHRHLPGQPHPSSIANPATTSQGPSSYNIFDVSVRWTLRGNIDLRGGIDNLLDRDPVITSSNPTNSGIGTTSSGYYDVLGRRYYVGLTARF